MKNFKKAIAILLAVLMVAFSVPFTALADDPVVLKAYIMPFNSATEYGYNSAATAKVLDASDISFADLGDDHKIVVIFATENLTEVQNDLGFMWFTDPEVLNPISAAGTFKGDYTDLLFTPSSTSYVSTANDISNFNDGMANTSFSETFDCSAQTETVYEYGTIPGIVWSIFEFEVLVDHADVTWEWGTDGELGLEAEGGTYIDDINFPEDFTFEFAPASGGETPEPTTDTYTFIDGTTQDVESGADAPANTAPTVWVDNGNGTHSRTVYSWDGFTEVGTTETANCNSETIVTPAQDYIHTADTLQDGITAVTACSVCGGNQQGGEVTVAQHTYSTEVTAPTCTAQGYTTYTCECGASYVDDYTAIDANNHVGTIALDESTVVVANCTTAGYTGDTVCSACGNVVTAGTATAVDPANHTGNLVTDEAVAATCIADGKTAGSHYDCCGAIVVAQETIPASDEYHDYQVTSSTGATCSTAGSVTYTCSICGDSYTDTGALDPTNHEGTLVTDEAVAATCVAGGKTAGSHWSCCGAIEVAQEDTNIDITNHVGTVALDENTVVVATCTAGGYTGDTVCSACGNVVTAGTATAVDPTNHTGNIVDDEAVPATRATTGLTAGSHYDCCGAIVVAQEVIPALGVQITVENGADVKINHAAYAGTTKVAYGEAYTLSTDAENFEAWMVGDKIVSTSATYTTAAFADTTYTAVFSSAAGTITFVDKFNNVLATYSADDVAAWDAIPEIASPFAGYAITGYDKTLDDIKAATGDITVNAIYEKVEQTFTVTANGATITVDGTEYDDTAIVTGYDVPVTVSADGATAWTINGKEVGFGASYTFYVTSDVTISFSTDAAEAAPVVTALNGNGDLQTGVKVRFVASRDVPASYTVVESGYLYGKEIAADDLVLENVGTRPEGAGSNVLIYKNSNVANVGQFAFTFGVTAQTTASARAYLIVAKDGVNTVYYADAQIYNY